MKPIRLKGKIQFGRNGNEFLIGKPSKKFNGIWVILAVKIAFLKAGPKRPYREICPKI